MVFVDIGSFGQGTASTLLFARDGAHSNTALDEGELFRTTKDLVVT